MKISKAPTHVHVLIQVRESDQQCFATGNQEKAVKLWY